MGNKTDLRDCFHRSEDIIVVGELLQEPSLHIGVASSLTLKDGDDSFQIADVFGVFAFGDEDVILHELVGQVGVGLLAFLLGDFSLADGVVGIVRPQLLEQGVFGTVDDASGLGELLGQGDGLGNVVDLILILSLHGSNFLSSFNKLHQCSIRFLRCFRNLFVPLSTL